LLLGACTDSHRWSMITEFCLKGDLEHYLHSPEIGKLKLSRKIQFGIDICSGMAWLTGRYTRIIHQDLKPANILIDSKDQCKVADFGLAVLKSKAILSGEKSMELGYEGGGSPLWMSPEALLKQELTAATDVYSFAIVYWEILTQTKPFLEYTDIEVFTKDIAYNHIRPPLQDVDPVMVKILDKCWDTNTKNRPSFEELIEIFRKARIDIYLPASLCRPVNVVWSSNEKYSNCYKMPYNEFMNGLLPSIAVKTSQKVQSLLAKMLFKKGSSINNQFMTPKKFAKIINWFGIKRENDVNVHGANMQNLIDLFSVIEAVLSSPWFFGKLTSTEAENYLKGSVEGTYLVRLNLGLSSPIADSPFNISRVTGNMVKHTRVYPGTKSASANVYHIHLGENCFFASNPSLKDLIDHLSSEKVITVPFKLATGIYNSYEQK